MEQWKSILELGANAATILGTAGIIFLFFQHFENKDARNIQLMHRCIDKFREWALHSNPEVNVPYLDLLNEELFYFQNKLLQQKVVLEWIEGIVDYIQVHSSDGTILTSYNNQANIEMLEIWKQRKGFYERIRYFVHPKLDNRFVIPSFDDPQHLQKKRDLANALFKHIKKYKF